MTDTGGEIKPPSEADFIGSKRYRSKQKTGTQEDPRSALAAA